MTIECNKETIDDLVKDFDAIVVGSDQVWGPAFHGTKVYFLGNMPSFHGKKISYAPCCAYNKVNENDKSCLSHLLQQFDSISVRNSETQTFVRDLINVDVPIVQDPIFLYDFEKEKNSFVVPYKKFILTYLIGEEINGGNENAIEEIKIVYGDIPVIAITLSTPETLKYFSWADQVYWNLSPFEWLSLIHSCTFLYTDSFHGMAFALKYQKPFIAFYSEEKRKSRFLDFMNRFDLSNVIVNSVSDIIRNNSVVNNVNYQKVNNLLEKELIKSTEFLNRSFFE
ncbi:polysaccharide pyruvyl transferase family protein [Thermophagus xiamenensis]|uniref:polysaccharide pyruvyl transferase family protein n=1 Tax=Thermophagus xiamenensis TaxID=385682 RepID=UPI001300C2EB|nr:polysaccharide pyruvyl transferase family protein [Thermophagus xiamenensis]